MGKAILFKPFSFLSQSMLEFFQASLLSFFSCPARADDDDDTAFHVTDRASKNTSLGIFFRLSDMDGERQRK